MRIAVEVTPLILAVSVVVPDANPFASPRESIAATLLLDDVHETRLVTFQVDPSLNVPVALNCCAAPAVITLLDELIAMDTRVALVTVRDAVPICPAKTAEIVAFPG